MTGLKFFRCLRGLSQHELTLKTRIPTCRISTLENGKTTPSPAELKRLGEALKADPDRLTETINEKAVTSWLAGGVAA